MMSDMATTVVCMEFNTMSHSAFALMIADCNSRNDAIVNEMRKS